MEIEFHHEFISCCTPTWNGECAFLSGGRSQGRALQGLKKPLDSPSPVGVSGRKAAR